MNLLSARSSPALLPASVFLISLPFSHTVALRLLSLAIAVAITFITWRSRPTPPIPFKWPLLFWAGLATLSLSWATSPSYSLGEIKNEIGYTMLTFFMFYNLTQGEREWKVWRQVLKIGFLAISVSGVMGYWLARAKWNVGGLHGGAGDYSTYLITISPFLLLSAIKNPHTKFLENLGWLLLPILLLGGYLTLNRAFWPALIAVYAVFGFLYAIRFHAPKARKRILGVFLIVTILVLMQFIDVAKQKVAPVRTDTELLAKIIKDDPRILIWKYAIENIKEHPLTGAGFGRDAMQRSFKMAFPDEQYIHSHNLFLDYALQMGIGGVLALSILFFAICREFWILYRATNLDASLIGIFGLSLVAGIIVKNMTDDFFVRQHTLLFWALIGMSLGYGKRLLMTQTPLDLNHSTKSISTS